MRCMLAFIACMNCAAAGRSWAPVASAVRRPKTIPAPLSDTFPSLGALMNSAEQLAASLTRVSAVVTANLKRDSAQDMSSFEASVSLSCFCERIDCRDRNAEPALSRGALETLKVLGTGYRIVGQQLKITAALRPRLNAVRVGHASTRAH